MHFTQLLLAFAITFTASTMALENKFFCHEHRFGECCKDLREDGTGRDCVDAKQLDRELSFKDDENRYDCKDLDDKSAFCCKYSTTVDAHGAQQLLCKAADPNDTGSVE